MEKLNYVVDLKLLFKLQSKGEKYVTQWLMLYEFIPNKYVCSKCGKDMDLVERNDVIDKCEWHCSDENPENLHCVTKSVRTDSWLSRSHLATSIILQITYMWTKKLSDDFITYELDLPAKTVADWKLFFRKVCMEMCLKEKVMLGGPQVLVEMSDMKFTGHNVRNENKLETKHVIAFTEKGTDKNFLQVITVRTGETLLNIIEQNILPESIIISDCWKEYNFVSNKDFSKVKKSHNFIFKNTQTLTDINAVRGTWNGVKKQIQRATNAFHYLDSLLCEYMWLKRHKGDSHGTFITFMKAASDVYQSQTLDLY